MKTILHEPNLMPYQDKPFNGDFYIEREFLALKKRYDIKYVIETGTCLGYTTKWLSENFEMVDTIEINENYFNIAETNRLSELDNVETYKGDTVLWLKDIMKHNDHSRPIIFLDAHWGNNCPLEEELDIIAVHSKFKPIIVIHDFKVPDKPELDFDSYGDTAFTYEWLEQKFINIYSKDKFEHYYNSIVCGAQRGVIFILPKQ